MNFMELVKLRKSVRSYKKGKPIDARILNDIMDAARLAPSAKNLQEWKFVVVRDPKVLSKMVPICKDQGFIADASAVVVGCSNVTDYVMMCGQPAYVVDVSIALEHIALMAADLGIGSCWIGSFYEDKLKRLLDIPDQARIVNLLTLGYPVQELSKIVTTTRKSLDDIVCYERWYF